MASLAPFLNRLLQGTARGWSTASPSYVLHVMRSSKAANPVILVDELDKTKSDGRNGDIRATLLTMLEPLTDIFGKDKRSEIMSRIKGRDTKPELAVRRRLTSAWIGMTQGASVPASDLALVMSKYQTPSSCFMSPPSAPEAHATELHSPALVNFPD